MNWEIIGSTGEWAGAIAVVATLFYLAVQIRQNTNSMRGQTEMEYTKETVAWVSRISANPNLQELWRKGVSGEPMDPEERQQYMWFNIEWFFLCEGMFRQYNRGLLDESTWNTLADALVAFLVEDDVLREWWDSGTGILSQDYKDAIEKRRAISSVKWKRGEASQKLLKAFNSK